MIPAAVPHPRLTLAHRFTRDKQIWVGRAVGFLQCADGAMSFGLREGIALALALLWIGASASRRWALAVTPRIWPRC